MVIRFYVLRLQLKSSLEGVGEALEADTCKVLPLSHIASSPNDLTSRFKIKKEAPWKTLQDELNTCITAGWTLSAFITA